MQIENAARQGGIIAFVAVAVAVAAACAGTVVELDVQPPPQEEFGYGPRVSERGLYEARVQPERASRIGQMHGWRLEVRDRAGVGVAGATIEVDGGMPQHGHGLPTKPRVTKDLGGGAYEVEGMRFNMGGWWIVTFRIGSPAGTDVVVFNLRL